MSVMVSDMGQKETYRSLVDYFSGKKLAILVCQEPSLIRVEFGSFISWTRGNEKGEADVTITKSNGSCYVNLNFDFSTAYGLYLIIALTVGILIFTIGWAIYSPPTPILGFQQSDLIFIGFVAFLMFLFALAIGTYNVSETRKKFLNELSNFLSSLSSVGVKG